MTIPYDYNGMSKKDAVNRTLRLVEEYWTLPDHFLAWIKEFFRDGGHLDVLFDKYAAFDSYREKVPGHRTTVAGWTRILRLFCQAVGWEWCPPDAHPELYDALRAEYRRRHAHGEDVMYFIRTMRNRQ